MRSLLTRLATWWALLGGIVLLVIVAVTVLNIGAFALDRLLAPFGARVPAMAGYEEFVRLTISCGGLMLFPYCQLRHGHIAVDLFVEALPVPVRSVIDTLSAALMTALALFLLYWMVPGMLETRRDQAVSGVLGWHEWLFYLPGLVSVALWAAIAAMQFVDRFQRAETR